MIGEVRSSVVFLTVITESTGTFGGIRSPYDGGMVNETLKLFPRRKEFCEMMVDSPLTVLYD